MIYMEHLERVLMAINLKEPDRVPIDLGGPISGISKVAYDKLINYLGFKDIKSIIWDKMQGLVEIDERILNIFGIDFRHIHINAPTKEDENYKEINENCYINEWGIMHKKQFHGYYYEIIEQYSPLYNAKNIEDIENYKGAVPHSNRFKNLYKKAKEYSENGFAVTADAFTGGILELAVWLRGFNKFYRDIAMNIDFVNALLNKTLESHKSFWKEYLNEVGDYINIVLYGDDYGHQQGLLISPKIWREYIKPKVKELISLIKNEAKHVKIQLHSCGSIEPIINDLIEIGFDIINPIQPRAKNMDSILLKEKYGKNVCFHGGIDIQYILPRGTQKEVENEVKNRIKALAPGGGYILAAAHNIQPDIPPENIVTMYKSALQYGKYPLTI